MDTTIYKADIKERADKVLEVFNLLGCKVYELKELSDERKSYENIFVAQAPEGFCIAIRFDGYQCKNFEVKLDLDRRQRKVLRDENVVKIGISFNKSAFQIAKDIQRRFIKEALEVHTHLNERAEAWEKSEQAQVNNFNELCRALKSMPSEFMRQRQETRESLKLEGEYVGSITAGMEGSESVKLEFRSLSPKIAKEILEVIKQYR